MKRLRKLGIAFSSLLVISVFSFYCEKRVYDHLSSALVYDDTLINLTCYQRTEWNSTKIDYKTEVSKSQKTFITLHDSGGRMGNQMFQIASLIATAKRMHKIPVIYDSFTIPQFFNIPCVSSLRFKIRNLVRFDEKSAAKFTEFLDLPSNNITTGRYLQSWKYFIKEEEFIRKTFTIQEKYQLNAKEFIQRKSVKGYKNVCLHVRRGDFLKEDRGIAGTNYIDKAIGFFKSKYRKVQFIVLSDDMEWCKRNIHNVIYSPFTQDIDDMVLMTLCSDVIITCGTFGWWGAWLSNGTTVYFKGYPDPNSSLAKLTNVHDYYPQNWIGL